MGKKPDKDQQIHLKIKSTLKSFEKRIPSAADADDVDLTDADESDVSDVDLKWKDNLTEKAAEAFYRRKSGKGTFRAC